jgi:hypothetical protein
MSFALANLPPVSSLSVALRTLEKDVGAVGSVILKMDKGGHWIYGAEQTEVESDSTWAVNPFSFIHGYIAWGDGEVLGEMMVPVTEPKPELPPVPHGAKKGWEVQVGMSLKCLSGPDKGLEVRFTTTSVGGKRAVNTLGVAIAGQCETTPGKPVPVVSLKKDSYQHKSYGKIYTPVFEIQDWASMDGQTEEAEEGKEEAAPARRRRSA